MAELGDARLRCPACDAPILLPLTQLGADLTSITLAIDLGAVRAHIAADHPQEPVMDASDRHPGTAHIARYFDYAHLPEHLQAVSKPCHDLAEQMLQVLSDGPELTVALRKLLEAKDAFVRAALDG